MTHNIFHPVYLRQDSVMQPQTVDTTVIPSPVSVIENRVTDVEAASRPPQAKTDSLQQEVGRKTVPAIQVTDTLKAAKKAVYNPYIRTFNTAENFLISNSLSHLGIQFPGRDSADSLSGAKTTATTLPQEAFPLQARIRTYVDWVLPVILVVVLLFIWIKIFYNKFFSFLANSLISYQLSVKLFREKNVLLKRVSLVLDVIYYIVLAFFLYESFTFLQISPARLTSYNLFLFFFNILILYAILRSIALRLFNYLFKTEPVISEFVHNNFIINKSIGIILFPVTIALCYMPESLAGILLVTGLTVLGAGIIFKIIRGYQIIIRKDILLFYLILYLCTLEILPLFIGYKVFMSLL